MILAPITRKDFPLWSEYRGKIYPLLSSEFDSKEMESIFASKAWHCWFIERNGGEKVGLVELSLRNIVDGCLSSPVPYLEGLYLSQSERGKGYGTKIVEMIKAWCGQHGYTELATDTELRNTSAQRFYERLGFEQVDTVVEYRIDIDKT